MKRLITKKLFLAAVLCCISVFTIEAQDIKPVKDKATKLFGYQDKSKSWVIEPRFEKAKKFDGNCAQVCINGKWGIVDCSGEMLFKADYDNISDFDRFGLATVMIKNGKSKTYGVIKNNGDIIIPVECAEVNIRKNQKFIMADRWVELNEPARYNQSHIHVWGVYDLEGNEIWPPHFSTEPKFNMCNGLHAIARDRESGLVGVISSDGEIIVPFEYIGIYMDTSDKTYHGLSIDLVDCRMDMNGRFLDDNTGGRMRPGVKMPYFTGGDDLKAIAYGHNGIGIPLYKNMIASCSIPNRASSSHYASLYDLCGRNGRNVDFGPHNSNFIRIELAETNVNHPGNFSYLGTSYTLEANLYNAYGQKISTLSNWGTITATIAGGAIYEGEGGKCLWTIFTDHNAPAGLNQVRLSGLYYTSGNYASILGLDSSCDAILHDWYRIKSLHRDLVTIENCGIPSYSLLATQSPAEMQACRRLREKYPVLNTCFFRGEVLYAEAAMNGDGFLNVALEDHELIYRSEDNYASFNCTIKSNEEIFWGADNGRFVRIDLVAHPVDRSKFIDNHSNITGYWDDVYSQNFTFTLQINLYESDGCYVRTLAEASRISHVNDRYIYIQSAGMIFSKSGFPSDQKIKFKPTVNTGSNNISSLGEIRL